MKMPDPIRKDPLFKTRDHVVPKSRGGKLNKANTVWCCSQCNESKGSKSLWQWESFLSRRYGSKRTSEWQNLKPVIITNVKKHPLYNPDVDRKSFLWSDRARDLKSEIKAAEKDPYNFHEDYIELFRNKPA